MKKTLGFAMALAAFGGTLEAATITLSSSAPPSGTFVQSGSPVSGNFNLASAGLGPAYFAPYTITSASVSFGFSDDQGEWVYSGQWYSGSNSYWSGNTYHTNYYYTESWNNAPETAVVSLGSGQTMAGSSPYQSSSNTYTTNGPVYYWYTVYQSYSYSCGWRSTCWGQYPLYDVYQQQHTVTTTYMNGNTGNFGTSGALSSVALADLAVDGVLPFTISAQSDFIFNWATMTLNVEPNPVVSVPEPAPSIILGLGLAALAGWQRRRTRRR